MKKVGILGSMLGAGLLQFLAAGGGWKVPSVTATPPRTHRNVGRYLTTLYRPTDRTTAARHWHNPADPVQAARIGAAAAKRERKSEKLNDHTRNSVSRNRTVVSWKGPFPDYMCRNNLNPFYVAK